MKLKISYLLTFLIISIRCISQELVYTHPIHMQPYSDKIELVELYSMNVEHFDTTTISSRYQITSSPIQTKFYQKGKLIKIEQKAESLTTYHYDSEGNISSRVFTNKDRQTEINYILNQADRSLTALGDNRIEAIYFDNKNRVVRRLLGRDGIMRKWRFATKTAYSEDRVSMKENFQNGELKYTEEHFYTDNELTKIEFRNNEGDLTQKQIFSYEIDRKNIDIQNYRNSIKTSQSKEIYFYDKNGNIIKEYKIFFQDTHIKALINEWKLIFSDVEKK